VAKPKGGLTKWFKEDWVDIGSKNEDGSHKKCGRSSAKKSKRKYPKCVPKAKAKSMTASQKKSAVKRKRAKPQGVGGKPTNVKTILKAKAGGKVSKKKAKPIRKTTGKGGNYRPTKAGAGMTKKGVKAYRKKNPGSKLKTAVTGKVKKGSKAAKRRKSYCARSLGQLKRSSAKTRNNPNSRIRQARRRWKC
tara:strand:+ start:985 stop:1557 length:573 start_codon:yes stop_codon:yes gene_type:complete